MELNTKILLFKSLSTNLCICTNLSTKIFGAYLEQQSNSYPLALVHKLPACRQSGTLNQTSLGVFLMPLTPCLLFLVPCSLSLASCFSFNIFFRNILFSLLYTAVNLAVANFPARKFAAEQSPHQNPFCLLRRK